MVVGRLVAERLEGLAVGPHGQCALGVRLPLGQRLVQVRELGEPGQRAGPVGDLPVALGDDLVDARAQGAVLECVGDATGGLDPAELLPAGDRQVVGELLDGERATGGVGDLRDVGLLDQQGRGVARDPACERVRQPEARVERQHRHRVGTAHTGREGSDAGAQHVHPRVVLGHHRPRGHGVQAHVAVVLGRTAELEHPRPHPAYGAQLGDRHELVVAGRQPELHQPDGVVDRDPGGLEGAQVVRAERQHVAELLHVGGTEVVHRGSVHDQRPAAELSEQARDGPRWLRSERQRASRNHAT